MRFLRNFFQTKKAEHVDKVTVYGYSLLRLATSPDDKPIWFIIADVLEFGGDTDMTFEESLQRKKSAIEEHVCPATYVRVEAIIVPGYDDPEDPHGLFQFVEFKATPADWDEDDPVWADLFPQVKTPSYPETMPCP